MGVRHVVIPALTSVLLVACSSPKPLTLMPPPVIYHDGIIDPFAHLRDNERSTRSRIFYATNRHPLPQRVDTRYGNGVSSSIHFGEAVVRMGGSHERWEDLVVSSLATARDNPVPLTLESVSETARAPIRGTRAPLDAGQRRFAEDINRELHQAIDKEIMVYVHGTKVDFTNAAVLAAEIDHFAGRDFVGVAFSWPSHQNILYYLSRIDVRRARHSSEALAEVLEFLATHTCARRINVLSYSAGGKVASKALAEMRNSHSDLDAAAMRRKFRLGSVVFAAADVGIDTFLERLPAISECAEQVVLTVTDDDNALKAAERYMGGKTRVGELSAEKTEEDFIVSHHLRNVEIIDVSHGSQVRGFDITGHHYWYRHPWMSSDIVFLMRTDLPPHRRGLTRTELEGIWYLAPDYPRKVRAAAGLELISQW